MKETKLVQLSVILFFVFGIDDDPLMNFKKFAQRNHHHPEYSEILFQIFVILPKIKCHRS
jgi:hypothetical protein